MACAHIYNALLLPMAIYFDVCTDIFNIYTVTNRRVRVKLL